MEARTVPAAIFEARKSAHLRMTAVFAARL
jgi:hypothetical protein